MKKENIKIQENNELLEVTERKKRIGRILRYYRELNKLSVKKVSEIITENLTTVSYKTIYGWEKGLTQPNADNFLFLCKLYSIENILQAFEYVEDTKKSKLQPTEFEYELLKQYREHPEMHTAVHKLLDIQK